jgi:hypothetical protein
MHVFKYRFRGNLIASLLAHLSSATCFCSCNSWAALCACRVVAMTVLPGRSRKRCTRPSPIPLQSGKGKEDPKVGVIHVIRSASLLGSRVPRWHQRTCCRQSQQLSGLRLLACLLMPPSFEGSPQQLGTVLMSARSLVDIIITC